jgi:hypothetical protein
VAATLTQATGTAERTAAEEMIVRYSPGAQRITLGADKGYDAAALVADLRAALRDRRPDHTPSRLCGEPAETQAHRGAVRLAKTIGGLARPMLRGAKKLGFKFTLTMASYNLIRLPKRGADPAPCK